jgi:hypothetical protein
MKLNKSCRNVLLIVVSVIVIWNEKYQNLLILASILNIQTPAYCLTLAVNDERTEYSVSA